MLILLYCSYGTCIHGSVPSYNMFRKCKSDLRYLTSYKNRFKYYRGRLSSLHKVEDFGKILSSIFPVFVAAFSLPQIRLYPTSLLFLLIINDGSKNLGNSKTGSAPDIFSLTTLQPVLDRLAAGPMPTLKERSGLICGVAHYHVRCFSSFLCS